jgi:hypothetical protein
MAPTFDVRCCLAWLIAIERAWRKTGVPAMVLNDVLGLVRRLHNDEHPFLVAEASEIKNTQEARCSEQPNSP